ncbi:sugar transport protein 1-like, partial [Cicer arietinum]
MAIGGIASTGGVNKKYPGKLTHFVLRSCLVAAMGGLIFGYDIGISGGVTSMGPFLDKFFRSVAKKKNHSGTTNKYCQYNSQMLTLFTSSLYLAALLSSLAASTVSRKFGRQRSMLFGGLLFFAGGLFNFIAQHVWMLIVGRVLLGFGVGFANQAVPLYLSEMAPSKYRGCLNIGFQLLITFGIVFANVLNFFFGKITSDWGWRSSLGGAMIPALVIIIGSLWLPDTPHSMIDRGNHHEAKEQLQKIRGVDNVDEEFNDLVAASIASTRVEQPLRKLRERKYRPQVSLAFLIPMFQQLTGINVIMFYAPVLFNSIGFKDKASLMSAIIT